MLLGLEGRTIIEDNMVQGVVTLDCQEGVRNENVVPTVIKPLKTGMVVKPPENGSRIQDQ